MFEVEKKIFNEIAQNLNIRYDQVLKTVELIDSGNTIPFIARYRKEVTDSLSDVQIRELSEQLEYLRSFEERKADIKRLIEEAGKLNQNLIKAIDSAKTKTELEDIYRPFKQKRKTKASIAREKGLEEFANYILLNNEQDILKKAEDFINLDKDVKNINEAILGAINIITEYFSDSSEYRFFVRNYFEKNANIISKVIEDEEDIYKIYHNFSSPISKMNSYRILAINRGEKEGKLKINIDINYEDLKYKLINKFDINLKNNYLLNSFDESLKKYIIPAIEREIRSLLTEQAQEQAIKVFAQNLKQKLMQPPFKNKVVMGYDPGYRTGCKICVLNEMGKLEEFITIYPVKPQEKIKESKEIVKNLINKYNVDLIAIGNGTASRESEDFISKVLKEVKRDVNYVIVDEAGASVYSASELANEEYPNIDVSIRGAISIAARLQDPLSELVKIDPKSIGVGQYQHSVNQKRLSEVLDNIVIDTVNAVGVDVNTASETLLSYISGITKKTAKSIIEKRYELGGFKNRTELKKVKGIGNVSYQQSIGFLRINGDNIFDRTGVHPEDYEIFEEILKKLSLSKNDIGKKSVNALNIAKKIGLDKISNELNIHKIKLIDIISEIDRPARDPRLDIPTPILRQDILTIEDLKQDMILKGTVRNVVDFGAFVDIGVKYDGLIHISKMSNNYIKHPLDILKVGDVVEVKIIDINLNRNKISLSMI